MAIEPLLVFLSVLHLFSANAGKSLHGFTFSSAECQSMHHSNQPPQTTAMSAIEIVGAPLNAAIVNGVASPVPSGSKRKIPVPML